MGFFLPVLLALTLGAEVPAAPETRVVPAVYSQWSPDVASNGRESLAVWLDPRGWNTSFRATRLRGEHAVDAFGFEIAAGGVRSGHVASNGEAYLAAYTLTDGSAHAVRIEDGRITQRSHLGRGTVADVASDGGTYCILAGASAVVADAHGVVLATIALPANGEAVVAHPRGGYRVFATVNDQVVMLPLERTGLGEALRLQPAGGLRTINAVAGRNQILVAWMPDSRVAYTIVDFDGNVTGAMRHLRYDSGSTRTRPSLGWDGREFLIGWATADRMWAMRVGVDGAPQAASAAPLTTQWSATFAAAHDGRSTILVTAERLTWDAYESDVMARRIDSFAAYASRPPSVISFSGVPQRADALAAARDGTALAVFTESSALRAALRGRDGALRVLDLAPPVLNGFISRAAAADDLYLVVSYVAEGTAPVLHVRRVRSNGEVLDPAPIAIPFSRYPSLPAVGSDGTRFLVVWASEDAVRGSFIGRDGSAGAPLEIARVDNTSGVDVVWTGEAWLVSWHDQDVREHRAARLSSSGALLDPPFAVATSGSDDARSVSAAADDGALVVWNAWNRDGFCLSAAAFAADGTMRGSPRTLVCEDDVTTGPSFLVAWDGAAYSLFWSVRASELRTMRLTRSGIPFGDVTPVDGVFLGGAAPVNGRLLLFYSRVSEHEPYGGVLRAFLREATPGAVPRRMRSARP